MEPQTYDPVLSSEELPKWRLTKPVRPPEPGRALVLVRDSGPSLTIRSGEEIPSSRFGAYSGMFTVDMSEHRLVLDIPLLSRDHTFSFRSRVDLVCRVADPAQVVSRGIRDMSATLFGYFRQMLRETSRDYDIAEFHQAERALNARVVASPATTRSGCGTSRSNSSSTRTRSPPAGANTGTSYGRHDSPGCGAGATWT